MSLDRATLIFGLRAIADHMEAVADELNTADGKLGDGDLGITMVRGGREVTAILDQLPPEIGESLMKVAQAFTRISGSSFGTLIATGLMSAAKATRGRVDIPWSEISGLLAGAMDAMRLRGKAALGDKTILDALQAAAEATAGLDDPKAILSAATKAATETMDRFRDQQAKIGRARIFGEKSIGLDDPGMLAFRHMLDALAG
ncbi:dihydroxyacetone kinase subunit L [Dongia soli]|uniref:Dihydroxyacetone kinase subunit L n=1 Tax=Dongia soli TaxID=600628 RepID=A0ABU5E9Y9_9PROT|nr:dihydroxyacetone kinase subunit L [Dongia soli]MDY0882609.1 dihydroxyacetone kinase subunit L [Dongia soli]